MRKCGKRKFRRQVAACIGALLLMFTLLAALAMPGVAEEMAAGTAEPFTWEYLGTIAGAAAFTLLVVQFLKVPLDKVWGVPTRVFTYIIALAVMIVAAAFTSGITLENTALAVVNAFVVALTAYGAYEITFKKMDK